MSNIPSCANTPVEKCPACQHSSLSLLLLRPAPVPTQGPLAHSSTQRVKSDDALVSGLVPTITESRYVLRLLREGYVHMYIPAPPAGMKQWYSYRVSEHADVLAMTNPACAVADISCCREGHNKMGYKLLNIPRAHEIGEVWFAFSANQWSDTLKAKNAANPKVMQQVSLSGCGRHTFKPSADALREKVMDFAVSPREDKIQGDFPLVPLSAQSADDMAAELQRVAALHPNTKGHELAVVLRDPVGVAAELNAIRLRWHELAQQEVEKPDNLHPLNSSNALMGIRQSVMDQVALESFEAVAPIKTKSEFEQGTWPAGTTWQALTKEEQDKAWRDQMELAATPGEGAAFAQMYASFRFSRPDLGWVVYPDLDERMAKWTKKATENSWQKFSKYYDEAARAQWIKSFDQRMQVNFYTPLQAYETDWLNVLKDACTTDYFKLHFDQNDPNRAFGVSHVPGLAYAQESSLVFQPEPKSQGKLLDDYLNLILGKPITDEMAIALRAIVGNQKEVIDVVHAQLTGDAGKDGMRDKTYDVLKGILGLESNEAVVKKYGWLIGNTLATFSMGQMLALSGALASVAAKALSIDQKLMQFSALTVRWWGIQQMVDIAAHGALAGKAPKMPVLLVKELDQEALLGLLSHSAGRDLGLSKKRIKQIKRNKNIKVKMAMLSDTDAIKAVQGNTDKLLQQASSSELKLGKAATAAAASSAATVITEQQFARLFNQQATLKQTAINAIRESTASGSVHQMRDINMKLEGRLAIGSLIVQGIGLYNGVKGIDNPKDAQALRDSMYGMLDSAAGVVGGLIDVWVVAASTQAALRLSANASETVLKEAVKGSLKIGALKFLGGLVGAYGNVVNAYSSWDKAEDAKRDGDVSVRGMYIGSMIAFGFAAGPNALFGVSGLATALLKRNIQNAAVRAALTRIGAVGGAELLGVSVSGWGLILVGAGVGLQILAIVLTPDELQRWISRSYFGKDPGILWDGKRDDTFKKGDWPTEYKALQDAIIKAQQEVAANQPQAKAVGAK